MSVDLESISEATSGAFGALLSTTILYPLDTCKTKYQAEVQAHGRQKYRSISFFFFFFQIHQFVFGSVLGDFKPYNCDLSVEFVVIASYRQIICGFGFFRSNWLTFLPDHAEFYFHLFDYLFDNMFDCFNQPLYSCLCLKNMAFKFCLQRP